MFSLEMIELAPMLQRGGDDMHDAVPPSRAVGTQVKPNCTHSRDPAHHTMQRSHPMSHDRRDFPINHHTTASNEMLNCQWCPLNN